MDNAFVPPKPHFGRPIIVNATGSRDGIAFAARHSEIVFITSPTGNQLEHAISGLPPHTRAIREAAAAAGRQVATIINPMIVCHPTEREAVRYRDAIVAAADDGATDGFAASTRSGDAVAWRDAVRLHRPLGGNMHLVGSPEQIVDGFIKLKQAGCDGVQLTFYDFAPDLAYFGEAVLPLMMQAGLRVSLAPANAQAGGVASPPKGSPG